jgi:hypothetical protein
MRAEVECVNCSCAISKSYWLEPGVLEPLQPIRFGHFPVEALATKMPVPELYRAVVDDVVAWSNLTTIVATDLLIFKLDRIHF